MSTDTPDSPPAAPVTALPVDAMPSTSMIEDLADVFGLLGDPGRLRILITLLPGSRTVGELAEHSGLSPSATSHALRLLRSHRVVEAHRTGRNASYTIADEHVREFLERGLEHIGHTVLVHTLPRTSHTETDERSATDCSREP
jgi:DNA-binding transcriptional ArsR family regulator